MKFEFSLPRNTKQKALIDGMTDAGIWTDDNHKVIKSMTFRYGGLSGEKRHYKMIFEVHKSKEARDGF